MQAYENFPCHDGEPPQARLQRFLAWINQKSQELPPQERPCPFEARVSMFSEAGEQEHNAAIKLLKAAGYNQGLEPRRGVVYGMGLAESSSRVPADQVSAGNAQPEGAGSSSTAWQHGTAQAGTSAPARVAVGSHRPALLNTACRPDCVPVPLSWVDFQEAPGVQGTATGGFAEVCKAIWQCVNSHPGLYPPWRPEQTGTFGCLYALQS